MYYEYFAARSNARTYIINKWIGIEPDQPAASYNHPCHLQENQSRGRDTVAHSSSSAAFSFQTFLHSIRHIEFSNTCMEH